jgi:hypothetical protein
MTTHEAPAPDASRRVTVTRGRHGWEVKEERGNVVVHSATYTDWHRVERAAGFPVASATFRVLDPGESRRDERDAGNVERRTTSD